MKNTYLLFIVFAILISPKLSTAQDFEGELGVGYNINSIPTSDHVNGGRGGFTGTAVVGYFIGELVSLGAMYEANKWGYSTTSGNIDLAAPASSFNVYLCKHYPLPNLYNRPRYSEFCLRPYAGYTTITKGSPYVQQPAVSHDQSNNYKGGGFSFGLQVEFLHPISKYVSWFANVGGGMAFISGENTRKFTNYPDATLVEKIPYNLNYFTLTIGGVYRMWD